MGSMTITAFMDLNLQMWVQHSNLWHFPYNVGMNLIELE